MPVWFGSVIRVLYRFMWKIVFLTYLRCFACLAQALRLYCEPTAYSSYLNSNLLDAFIHFVGDVNIIHNKDPLFVI